MMIANAGDPDDDDEEEEHDNDKCHPLFLFTTVTTVRITNLRLSYDGRRISTARGPCIGQGVIPKTSAETSPSACHLVALINRYWPGFLGF